MKIKLIIVPIFLFSFQLIFGQINNDFSKELPKNTGWVSDFENIFSTGQENSLDSILSAFEKKTTIEIAIITIPEIMTTAENFDNLVVQISNYWGLGKKDKNNGILIGVSKGLRSIRISNGLGIESILTDEQTKKIIENTIIPNFKVENYYQGTLKGIEEIIKNLAH